MAANVETMMYVREKPWHGLGVEVSEAPNSEDALRFAGLDWNVRQENVFNSRGGVIKGFKANVRDSDDSVLGVVGDRYKVVQNRDALPALYFRPFPPILSWGRPLRNRSLPL